ncbi:hypothetical protein MMC24_000240 [Lignoscripta atroalba]|nr:hypothetical protein [Lignoscripta atroalba]
MSPTFDADVEAYYEAKESYTKLLKEAMAKEKSKEDPSIIRKPLTVDTDTREWVTEEALKMPEWEGEKFTFDYGAIVKAQAAAKEVDEKGKSKGRK